MDRSSILRTSTTYSLRMNGRISVIYEYIYIVYYRGKIVGGIYDDRFLVKPVKSAIAYMPNAKYELPYDGAKEMLLVDDVDNKEYLTGLFNSMYKELPALKRKNER